MAHYTGSGTSHARKYGFSLTPKSGGGVNSSYIISSASVSFNISEGYPVVTVRTAYPDDIEAFRQASISSLYNFKIEINEEAVITLNDLAVNRASFTETPEGGEGTASLIPKAAATASAYPASLIISDYTLKISELIRAIYNAHNSAFGSNSFSGYRYLAPGDPIALVPPRFIQLPYFEMVRRAAQYHGLVAMIDFSSRLRIMSPLSQSGTAANVTEHIINNSGMVYDYLQSLT